MTQHPLKRICTVLGVSRATAYRQTRVREPFYTRSEDDLVLERIRAVTKKRATYGHRRITARVNRLFPGALQREEDPPRHAHARPSDPAEVAAQNGAGAHGQNRHRAVERALVQ